MEHILKAFAIMAVFFFSDCDRQGGEGARVTFVLF